MYITRDEALTKLNTAYGGDYSIVEFVSFVQVDEGEDLLEMLYTPWTDSGGEVAYHEEAVDELAKFIVGRRERWLNVQRENRRTPCAIR